MRDGEQHTVNNDEIARTTEVAPPTAEIGLREMMVIL
jgi:hypothetical protein